MADTTQESTRPYKKWRGDVKANILRSCAAARRRLEAGEEGARGQLKALYVKYKITAQHELAWLKQRAKKEAAVLAMGKGPF